MALILRRRGIERVRPLAGGFYAWRDLGYPTISLERVTGGRLSVTGDRVGRPAACPDSPPHDTPSSRRRDGRHGAPVVAVLDDDVRERLGWSEPPALAELASVATLT